MEYETENCVRPLVVSLFLIHQDTILAQGGKCWEA